MAKTKVTPRKNREETIGIKCNKNFANLGTLKRHNRTFHEGTVQNFNCNICDANFTRKYNIKKHIREKHNGTDQENYTETTGTPKQMAIQVEKWVPPFEARKWDSTKKPTFRIIAGKSSVTYPEKKEKHQKFWKTEDKSVLTACVKAFHKIFTQFIGNGELYTSPEVDDESKEGKYKIWLNERYSDVYERLVELLQCKHATVKELSLSTLMKLVTAEGQNPITVITAKQSNFPIHRFQEIMRGLISVDYNHKDLITRFQEYLDYDDVRFHVLKFLIKDIKEKKQQVNNISNGGYATVSTVEKLSSLSTKGQQTLLDAVNTRKDDVFRRLHDEYSSLADVDIERLCYHKSCYKSYTSRVNLEKFVMPDVNNLKDTSNANQPCCSHPVQTRSMFTPFDWTTCIFCKHKSYKRDKNLRHLESDERLQKISELADHKQKYCFFLPPELKTRYTSAKLQRRLEKHYGNSIVIQTQKGQGRSNIVFSSSISIAEAIQAASHLKCELKLSEIEAEVEIGPINEDQTLHAAASIIRRQLQSLDISNETYPTPSEISLSYSTQHTPCLLTKFLLWIIDDKSYNGEDMSNRAGQQYAVQTFDQQLYAVAQQVKWSMPDVFHSHIIRLGGFHGLSCFIATVGKLWASAGLSDLLVDSGIYASNTVDQMLVGKQFNRGVRGLTLAYEALMVLLFKAFFNWCRDENRMKTIQPNVWKVFLDCHSSFAVPSTPQSTEDIEEFFNVFEEHILPLFEEFRTHYCSSESCRNYLTHIQISEEDDDENGV
ncbi:NOC4 [Mytilus edulis]|uniref:NOC4 n=1 Tax=Mytilus edulis TaxID=6550 RepID=A0A8S3S2Z4_MYTED|nr:NOC4 [Mytilus edulis]